MTRYLRTEMVSLDQLTSFPGNARRGRVDVIKESIEKNGQYRSLIVREVKNGPQIVLAGNQTMIAISELDGSQARCEIIECDDDTARRINLVDNRASDLAEDDEEALAELLRGLNGDAAGSGYTEDEIKAYVGDLEAVNATQAAMPPADFPEYDENIATEHKCPKCGYEFSGGGGSK